MRIQSIRLLQSIRIKVCLTNQIFEGEVMPIRKEELDKTIEEPRMRKLFDEMEEGKFYSY